MSQPFEARYSPARSILFAVLSAGFVVAGLWMIGVFGAVEGGGGRLPEWAVPIAGWAGIIFFGGFMVFHARKAVTGGVAVRIDARGMLLRDYSDQPIPWDDVTALSTQNMMGTHMLMFEVVPAREEAFGAFRRLSIPLNRSMSGYGCSLVVNNTDRSHAELLEALADFAPPRLLA